MLCLYEEMLPMVSLHINTYMSVRGEGGSQSALIWSRQTIYFFDKSDQIFVITAQMTIPLLAGTLLISAHCLHLSYYLHFIFFFLLLLDLNIFVFGLCSIRLQRSIIKCGDNHCC